MIVMPETMSVGFSGGPTYDTDRISLKGGGSRRLKNRDIPVHVYSISYENRSDEDVRALRDFFVDMRGAFRAFLFKDWMNFGVVAGFLGTGDGVETDFQLVQIMGTEDPYIRTIRHIKSGTLSVYKDAVLQTLTTDYTVSATGLVTFTSPPASPSALTASFEFYVPVTFLDDAFNESLPHSVIAIRNVADLALVEAVGE